jgi:nucleotide-binding universal stress UspA family protein
MKTILVPTDFSEPAKNALDVAVQLSKKLNGKVILLNIIEPIKSYVAATDGMYIDASVEQKYIEYLKENAQGQMKSLLSEYAEANIETHVSLGTIFSAVQEQVASNNVSLIVMGTMGVSGLDEVLIGSNTEKVVRMAQCPVLALKNKTDLESFKNILFATSLHKEQLPILKEVAVLQELLDLHLHLLYVNMPNNFYTNREIDKKKEAFIKDADLKNYSFHVYNEVNEENGIIYFSDDHQIDMITVATHQRTGLAHLISGSIAEDVVNHSKRPVLTFGIKYHK